MILNSIDNKEIKRYKKNRIIFKENDECFKVGIVVKGIVKIVTYTEDGKEIIYNIIKENEMFGNNLIFSSDCLYKGNVIASTDCTIAFISSKTFIKLLKTDNQFLIDYLKMNSDNIKELNSKIKLLSLDNLKDRFMYYLHLRNNHIQDKTISSIANEINVARESLSRLVHKLERDKIIKISNKEIKKV